MVAFYFDMSRCVGCHACQVACRDRNGLYNPGEIFLKVDTYEGGKFPTPWFFPLSIACNHCAKPACVAICPTGAMYKDEETGLEDSFRLYEEGLRLIRHAESGIDKVEKKIRILNEGEES